MESEKALRSFHYTVLNQNTKTITKNNSYYGEKPEIKSKYSELRNKIFDILGHECVRCGFSDKRALQFDHINGDGYKMSKTIGSSFMMYKYYIKNPQECRKDLQILCANCNWIKKYDNNEVGGSSNA